jgi:CubicO group peptidase (beta-lactamase class C family)
MVALGVVDHGRKTTYFVRGSQAKGTLDEHTQFQIGSITKVLTASILAQMVDAGQLSLTDHIQSYLPAGVIAPTYRGQAITLLSLATHMSGLPDFPANFGSVASPREYSVKMLDDALGATKLTRAAGTRWEYSNFGFGVLGQILADKARLSYGDLVKQRILDPLGMSDTVITGSGATRHNLAPAFEYGGAPSGPAATGALAPAGAGESDLTDMMAFLEANLDAPQGALGPEFAFAQQPRTTVLEWNMSMGLAWQIVLPPTHRVQGSFGDLPPGSLEKGGNIGGYSSFIGLNHDSNWAFVAMTNVDDDDFQDVIGHAISPSTDKMPVLWATVKREASPLSGQYKVATGRQMVLDIFKYNGDFYASVLSTTEPSKLTLLSRDRYSWDALQLTLTFHVNGRGHATSLTAVQGGKTMQAKRMRASLLRPMPGR